MQKFHRIWIPILLATFIFVFHVLPVKGNSAPPSTGTAWFYFDFPDGKPQEISGAQIQGCIDMLCKNVDFVYQFGECSFDGCHPSIAGKEDTGELKCAEDQCRLEMKPGNARYFRFAIQFQEDHYITEIAEGLPHNLGDYQKWGVVVKDNNVTLVKDWSESVKRTGVFFIFSGILSICVELLVAGFYFSKVLRIPREKMNRHLLMILMINMVTFPIVWFYFTSFITFSIINNESRDVLLYLSVLYSAFLFYCFSSEKIENSKLRVFFISYGFIYPIWMIFNTFGGFGLLWDGWTRANATIYSEAFAIIAEAGFIWLLSRKELRISQSILLSIIINTSSYLFGAFVNGDFLFF